MPACHAGGRGFEPLLRRKIRHEPNFFASIAQSVEQRTENPRVAGSIPARGMKKDSNDVVMTVAVLFCVFRKTKEIKAS